MWKEKGSSSGQGIKGASKGRWVDGAVKATPTAYPNYPNFISKTRTQKRSLFVLMTDEKREEKTKERHAMGSEKEKFP